uniref:Uncharacterized protein n=1 Tax=Aliivibrio wodanis TaxID=80852 RepID=A0A5Q4YXF4_9GAMM|nr:hypothetical protein AW0309160_00594 [Aliivibrio wodanis]
MILNHARKKQIGTSLIELLIASTIGLITLMLVGNIYIKGQQLYADRSKNLLLIQEFNDALRFVKEETQRAGFSGDNIYSAMLSGATDVIHISGSQISYVYQSDLSPVKWRSVSIKHELEALKICTESNLPTIPNINSCTRFYSLLDENIIKITNFTINQTLLGNSVSSAYLSLSATANLVDTTHELSSTIKIKQRNWK